MHTADLLTTVLLRELLAASERGMRALAVTSPTSLVAGLAARELGTPLGLATGFGVLDAAGPFPAVSLGERALGTVGAVRGPSADTFVALARGRVGVAVTPAQLDATGATNLSQVGGTDTAPGVALPGARGLPENNDAPGSLWYVFGTHSPRQLVGRVDSISGPAPTPGRHRRLLTPLGVFELDGRWRGVALAPGVDPADVQEATGFTIEIDGDVDVLAGPTDREQEALDQVDPLALRRLESAGKDEAKQLIAAAMERESVPA